MRASKILIVEDDRDLLKGLSIRLKASGYSVCWAMDAAMAASVARRELPDCILLDLGLPAGDGFVVMERLKKVPELRETPVVVITARDPESSRDESFNAGARAFLHKPVDDDELLATVREAMSEPALY